MTNESKIEAIEVSIEAAKEAIVLGECMDRMIRNPDFIKIIEEGYFKDEAARLVLFKSEPVSENTESQQAITKAIDAIGGLHQYLTRIYQNAAQMKKALTDDEVTRGELLAEMGE